MPRTFDRTRRHERELHESAERRESPSAAVVFEAIRHEGEDELRRHGTQLAWSALAAGLAMGFSFLAEGLLVQKLPETSWSDIISAFGYSLGFLIVVLGRQQLFTETPVIAVLPVLNARRLDYFLRMLRLWSIVLLANVAGTLAFAWVVSSVDFFQPALKDVLRELATEQLHGNFTTTMVGAIFAGWLIALMVWLLPFAETARFFVIIIVTWIIGLAGFPHVIAGSVEAFYGVLTDVAGWRAFLVQFFLPALIGNTIGGVVLVAALNYGQVAPPPSEQGRSGKERQREHVEEQP